MSIGLSQSNGRSGVGTVGGGGTATRLQLRTFEIFRTRPFESSRTSPAGSPG